MKKRILSLLLAAVTLLGMLPGLATEARAARTWIKDRSALDGSQFTQSRELAKALNSVFDGNVSVYHNKDCTNPVDGRIGTSNFKNDGVYKHVGPRGGPSLNSGTSCWIYGNGVYYTLFGEYVFNMKAGPNSETLDISTTSNKRGSYANFRAWGVRQGVGAMVRADGHTMIVLDYDEKNLTILDGNGDGRGLVSVQIRSWDDCDFLVAYIIQPKEAFFRERYPECDHSYENQSVCSKCGYRYKYMLVPADSGIYKVAKNCVPRVTEPYDSATADSVTLNAGATVEVTGSLVNACNQMWYQISYGNGKTGFVPQAYLTYVSRGTQEITCTVSTPAEGATIPKATYSLRGEISSRYPLATVEAYLDGKLYATVDPAQQCTVNLQKTDANYNLSFSNLEPGLHVLQIKARDIHRSSPVLVLTRKFITEGTPSCTHSKMTPAVTKPTCDAEGFTTNRCTACGFSYESAPVAALGHDFGDWEITTEVTPSTEGLQIRLCKRAGCGYLETDLVPIPEITEGWNQIGSKWYYYQNGIAKTGWLKSGGYWYYLASDGAMLTGLQQIGGKYYYLSSGGAMQTGWVCDGGKWYYMDASGVMQTGWISTGGKWYYLSSAGIMQTGWVNVNGYWYYMNGSGTMQTGLQRIGGKYYYLASGGAMQTGWQTVSGVRRYFGSNGAAVTAWRQENGKWYYLKDGAMQKGWLKDGSYWFFLDNTSGAMQTGWVKDGGYWYYMNKSGVMLTGTQVINGKTYRFNSSGVWIS